MSSGKVPVRRGIAFLIGGCALFVTTTLAFNGKKTSSVVTESVWITRPDGSLQCDEKDRGTENDPILKAKNELAGRGVQILEAKKRNDGKMRAQACGFTTGNETSFLIPKRDVVTAKELGFVAIP